MLVQIACAGGVSMSFDVNWNYLGVEDRLWFEVMASAGNGQLAPLRVVKELNGRAVNVSPAGANTREIAYYQSHRAQLAHFISVASGDTKYEAPSEQIVVQRALEAIYKAAGHGDA